MTVTDCHYEKTAVQKRERKKFSLFGKGLQTTDIDLHSTYIKKVQKARKLGNVGRCTSYPYFTHARKKVKIFFYIERYGNDLHPPTSFLFHRLEERSFSHTKQKHLQLLLYVNRHLPQAFSFYFCWFCPFQKVTRICILYACEEKSKNFLYIEGMEMTVTDCHYEKTAVQKRERKKFSLFGKGLQTTDIDLHSTCIKKVQKSPKNWGVQVGAPHIHTLRM